jgi:hypothetical protein
VSSKFLTRKEVGAAIDISSSSVARKEHHFGLDVCRDKICRKPIRYYITSAINALRERGIEVNFPGVAVAPPTANASPRPS